MLTADLASLTLTVGTNLVAETPVTFTIDATRVQQGGLQQNDVLDVTMVQNGTGIAVGVGLVAVVEIS